MDNKVMNALKELYNACSIGCSKVKDCIVNDEGMVVDEGDVEVEDNDLILYDRNGNRVGKISWDGVDDK